MLFIIKSTKILSILGVTLSLLFLSGCARTMKEDAFTRGYGPATSSAAPAPAPKINTKPPVITYQTNDPELQTYLKLFASLENGVQEYRLPFTAQENEDRLKRFEDEIQKFKIPNMDPAQAFAFREKLIEDNKKKPAPYHLTLLPTGADSQSNVNIFTQPAMFTDLAENKSTGIGVIYAFPSKQEMSDKYRELTAKLTLIFSANQGWEENQSMIKAGQYHTMYQWDSGFTQKVVLSNMPLPHNSSVVIVPNNEPQNGKYILLVSMGRSIVQARAK